MVVVSYNLLSAALQDCGVLFGIGAHFAGVGLVAASRLGNVEYFG